MVLLVGFTQLTLRRRYIFIMRYLGYVVTGLFRFRFDFLLDTDVMLYMFCYTIGFG